MSIILCGGSYYGYSFFMGQNTTIIKGELSPPSFNAFFKQIIPLKIHMNELILLVPNDFTKGILEDRYLNLIESSINQLSLKKYKVKFVLDEKYVEGLEEEPKSSNIPQKNYPNLNPKYTFDTFVIGNSNRFAHAACVAVANLLLEHIILYSYMEVLD